MNSIFFWISLMSCVGLLIAILKIKVMEIANQQANAIEAELVERYTKVMDATTRAIQSAEKQIKKSNTRVRSQEIIIRKYRTEKDEYARTNEYRRWAQRKLDTQ